MTKFLTTTLLAAGACLAVGTTAAQAQMQCHQHKEVLGKFADAYHESPVAGGLTQDGRLLQVLSSGDDGTWTIVLSKPDGLTCVIMAGEAWRKLNPKPVEQEPNA